MFGFISKKTHEQLVGSNQFLSAQLEAANATIDRLLLQAQETGNVSPNASERGIKMFAFDWDKANAFSIERLTRNDIDQTVIGYFINDEHHEWYFECDNDAHIQLVEEFRKYIEDRF